MRGERDVLRQPRPLQALLEQVADVDRLVLLGDVVELRQGPVRDALAAADRPLRALGDALGPAASAIVVPGNHDHGLLAPWLARRALADGAESLGLESRVDWRDGEPLSRIAAMLGPDRTEVTYPGVWIGEHVYATHGHYGDRHTTVPMLERLAAGAMARITGEGKPGPLRAEDYEAVLGPLYAWLDAIAQTGGPALARGRADGSAGASASAWQALAGAEPRGGGGRRGGRRAWRRRALAAGFPALVAALNRLGLGPLSPQLTGSALRHGSLLALAEVLLRLRVDARHVVSGHTHRAGPLPEDDQSEWRTAAGVGLVNCGCWISEPAFTGPDPTRSPYRAGFCVTISDDGPPRLLNLLDGVG